MTTPGTFYAEATTDMTRHLAQARRPLRASTPPDSPGTVLRYPPSAAAHPATHRSTGSGGATSRPGDALGRSAARISLINDAPLGGEQSTRLASGPDAPRQLLSSELSGACCTSSSCIPSRCCSPKGAGTERSLKNFTLLLDSAQRRLLQSVKTLAHVRKLGGLTTVQINIAEQQTNVAG
jgi:hypothetical protein